jgi:hypothetical protein
MAAALHWKVLQRKVQLKTATGTQARQEEHLTLVHLVASTPTSTQNKQQQLQRPVEAKNLVFAHLAKSSIQSTIFSISMDISHLNNHSDDDKT